METKIDPKFWPLLENERVDDLQINNTFIIQNKKMYCFTSDAVLLANYAKANGKDTVIDLCSGSGIVGILLSQKTKAKKIKCVEIQPEFCDMIKRSIMCNALSDRMEVVNCSVQNATKNLSLESASVIVCNPPYKNKDTHKITENPKIAMCKYETTLNFDELALAVFKLLKFGGKFYFVHETNRLAEIITTLKKYNLEPKNITFVYPKNNMNSHIMLVEAVKGGKSGIIVKPSVVLES